MRFVGLEGTTVLKPNRWERKLGNKDWLQLILMANNKSRAWLSYVVKILGWVKVSQDEGPTDEALLKKFFPWEKMDHGKETKVVALAL